MYDLIAEPKSFHEAKRQSDRMAKAAGMVAAGYKATPFTSNDRRYFVEGGADLYLGDLTGRVHCSCPDFERHGACCKHLFFCLDQQKREATVETREARRARTIKNRDLDF